MTTFTTRHATAVAAAARQSAAAADSLLCAPAHLCQLVQLHIYDVAPVCTLLLPLPCYLTAALVVHHAVCGARSALCSTTNSRHRGHSASLQASTVINTQYTAADCGVRCYSSSYNVQQSTISSTLRGLTLCWQTICKLQGQGLA